MSISQNVDFIERAFTRKLRRDNPNITEDEIEDKIRVGRKNFSEVAKKIGVKANDMSLYAHCIEGKVPVETLVEVYGELTDQSMAGDMIGNGTVPMDDTHRKLSHSGRRKDPFFYEFKDTYLGRYWEKLGVDIEKYFPKEFRDKYKTGYRFQVVKKDLDYATVLEPNGGVPIVVLTLGLMMCDQNLVKSVIEDEFACRLLFNLSTEVVFGCGEDSYRLSPVQHANKHQIQTKVLFQDYFTLLLEEINLYRGSDKNDRQNEVRNYVEFLERNDYKYMPMVAGLTRFQDFDAYNNKTAVEEYYALKNMIAALDEVGITCWFTPANMCDVRGAAHDDDLVRLVTEAVNEFVDGLHGDAPSETEIRDLIEDLDEIVRDRDITDEDGDAYLTFIATGRPYQTQFDIEGEHKVEIDVQDVFEAVLKTMNNN